MRNWDNVVISGRSQRQSFPWEFKLNVIDWFHPHGKNVSKTAKTFMVDHKLGAGLPFKRKCSLAAEARAAKCSRKNGIFPEMEKQLYREFVEMREEGKKVFEAMVVHHARQTTVEGVIPG